MQHSLLHFEEIDSTNTYLKRQYPFLANGTVVLADHQNAGKGRLGRTWVDDGRCLTFSILLTDRLDNRQIGLVPLLSGAAGVLTLRDLGFDARIKWPNDVLIQGRKVTGILVEAVSDNASVQAIIPGIGINLNATDFPEELQDKATSLRLLSGKTYDRRDVLKRYLAHFDDLYSDLVKDGSAILDICRKADCLKGKEVYLNYYGENLHATVLGITDDGLLQLQRQDGTLLTVSGGEVTLEKNYHHWNFPAVRLRKYIQKGSHMKKIDLSQYGITDVKEVVYNPSYDDLYKAEMDPELTGYEKGQETELGAVNVMTGVFTGRSPKDKFIVDDENSHDTVWWTSPEYPNDNHRASKEAWASVKEIAKKELSGKKLYVVDGFCGANKDTRMAVRFIMEVAWQAHFVKNMFIRPTAEEEENFKPDFVVYNASKAKVENWKELGLHSETAVMFNITSHEQVIVNTWYGGEMKKGMFSMMNYYLPLKGIASMHSSANTDMNGENTAVFFGLSGTGKTTLSTDPKRLLIGDDEHGWDDNGVFNLEGGCYAKVIDLDKDAEPDIYGAIRRDALLENVTVDEKGVIDFHDKKVTENTRVSYPIYHINKIVKPISHGPAAKNVIFLSADAFGVLPPVSILTPEQTKYYFLSGFTAKLAGTERGITEPTPTFSACFGQAFLELHPTKYAEELVRHMEKSGAKAYLVNTGWNGTGKRISIKDTRGIIDAILDGAILKAPTKKIPFFDFEVPTELEGVATSILDPRDTYADSKVWDEKARDLAGRFIKNFHKYETNDAGKALVKAGPHLD